MKLIESVTFRKVTSSISLDNSMPHLQGLCPGQVAEEN